MSTQPSTHPQHTPGPWYAQERHANYAGWVVLHENGNGRRRVDADKDGTFTEANARLIAAGPEMWDLLKLVFDDEAMREQYAEPRA